MYIPNANKMEEQAQLLDFMRQHSFATLVSMLDGHPFASHLPLVADEVDDQVILRGHFAKANPHWRAHEAGGEMLIIFQGPHAYITPRQYTVSEAVPTWNYVAVHAYGQVRLQPNGAEAVAALEQMFATFDASFQAQWDGLTEKYKAGMLNGIMAFSVVVTRLEGKAKLSQNRPVPDQRNVADWLLAHEAEPARAIGHLMQANLAQAG